MRINPNSRKVLFTRLLVLSTIMLIALTKHFLERLKSSETSAKSKSLTFVATQTSEVSTIESAVIVLNELSHQDKIPFYQSKILGAYNSEIRRLKDQLITIEKTVNQQLILSQPQNNNEHYRKKVLLDALEQKLLIEEELKKYLPPSNDIEPCFNSSYRKQITLDDIRRWRKDSN